MRSPTRFLATALLALAIVPACKFNCTIGGPSTSAIEDTIVASDAFKAAGVTSATCPKEVEWKAGNTFKCTGSGEGKTFSITVTLTDDNGKFNAQLDQ